jgi:hypothetical protein
MTAFQTSDRTSGGLSVSVTSSLSEYPCVTFTERAERLEQVQKQEQLGFQSERLPSMAAREQDPQQKKLSF